jgi:hypothetical protein
MSLLFRCELHVLRSFCTCLVEIVRDAWQAPAFGASPLSVGRSGVLALTICNRYSDDTGRALTQTHNPLAGAAFFTCRSDPSRTTRARI